MTQALKARYLTARRAWIERQFSRLNPQQRQGVLTTAGPLLLLAGAGSGKTTVLINRIANLLWFGEASDSEELAFEPTEEQVETLEALVQAPEAELTPESTSLCALRPPMPWNIIAITFTNKAAGELKSRLAAMLGPQGNDVWAMTFHSACCRILRRDIERLGYSSSFTIYDTSDSEHVIKAILRDMSLDEKTFAPRMVLTQISRAKDRMQLPEDLARSASGDYRMELIARVYRSYQKQLQEANALDFDDLILLTVQLLERDEEVREFYQRKFRYVLIDEYQDTNALQYRLAALLAGGSGNICVVGDDDQSIYRFRGATIENILSFESQYPGAKVIRLEQNYRSTQSILNAANAVIAHNVGRKGKRLWTKNEAGAPVEVYEAMNESDEAAFVAREIAKCSRRGDCAVLYRNNAQSNALEYAFKHAELPYRMIGGTRFFERAEVKDMLAYLQVINNPDDDLRLRRIINTPARGIGAKTLEMAARLAEASGLSLYRVISNARAYPALEKAEKRLQAFTELIEGCSALLHEMTLPDFYDELLLRSGYSAMLEQKNDVESHTRLENVRELNSSIVSYLENAAEPTLNGFLEEIALYTDLDQYDAEADCVVMMTMHAAKGLEFPRVFLVGMEEGLFPSMRAIGEQAGMEEERRLCYVAMTRAKQHLTVCYAHQRMLYGRTTVNRPSRFLGEIPGDCKALHKSSRLNVQRPVYAPAQPRQHTELRSSMLHSQSGAAAGTAFRQGDTVLHDAFGQGLVLSVRPAGGDALLEIAFDRVGTKRLMANYAANHMKKA